ncbi:hypothetical protein RD792_002457 [Penstemon davidsonii]|uniref:Uncharacterized protein n=1 Tax=Penstemon davidsonii TaxID=160366 RepID=A0ABR0DRT1_9LAMI|nr:hypothetical protein RD792_002457 [Penstemon davidsonii]
MGRAPCCDQKDGLKKGPWTPEEDQKLIDYIHKNGCGNWRTLPKNAGLQRCGKSCRLRWTNYLRPDIKRGRFSFEEEEAIIQLHSILGNKWSAIAARLPGRTDNEIKNYWNTHIRKRLLRMGIDPVTHSPRLDLLDLSNILNSQSQINFSRLLGMQSLINPDLIRLASSILSSQRQNQDFLIQNQQPSNHINPTSLNQMQIPLQNHSTTYLDMNNGLLNQAPDHNQFVQYDHDVQQFPQNLAWEECNNNNGVPIMEDNYVPVANYDYNYGPGQSVLDQNPSSETTSTFQSNSSASNNFGFQTGLSNISTPSSSPAPLNSNSTYNEDERESYCTSMLKFEIPDIFDVNDFM